MKHLRRLSMALATFLLMAAPLCADEKDYRIALGKGDDALANDQLDMAIDAYNKAKMLAVTDKDPAQQGEASFRLIIVLRRRAEADPKMTDKWNAVINEYRVVMTAGTPSQRELARNNLGVLYLRLEKPAEAVKVFEDNLKLVNADAHVYLFNYGKALEGTKKNDDAYQQYRASLDKRPNYAPAAERAVALLRQRTTPHRLKAAIDLFHLLLGPKAHQAQLVGAELPRFFVAWKEQAADLLPVLLAYYAIAGVNAETFKEVELPRLKEIEKATDAFHLDIEVLKSAFDFDALDKREKPIFTAHAAVLDFFPAKSRLVREGSAEELAFSRLLQQLAELNYRTCLQAEDKKTVHQAARRALQLATAAFFLDSRNTEALVAAASVLGQYRVDLDPKNEWTKKMTDGVFDVKLELYRKVKTRRDWSNLYSVHLVLGDLYHNQMPPVWGKADDLHSALGQWNRALEVEKLIRTGHSSIPGATLAPEQVNPRFPESPTLRLNLAVAYRETKDAKGAFSKYLDAAEHFADAGNPDRTHKLMGEIHTWLDSSPLDTTPDEKQQLADLDRIARNADQALKSILLRTTSPDGLAALAFDREGKRLEAVASAGIGPINREMGQFELRPSFLSKLKPGPVGFAFGADRFGALDGANLLIGTPEKEQVVFTLKHQAPVVSFAFSDDGKILASADAKAVYFGDARDGKPLKDVAVPDGPATSLVLSADGNLLAGTVGKEIRLWTRKGEPESRSLKGHDDLVTAAALRNDGKVLVSGDSMGRVRFWDSSTGEARKASLPAQRGWIVRLLFTSDGKTLLVAAEGGPVRLFNAESGEELVRLPYRGTLTAAVFSGDGQVLAIGSAAVTLDGLKTQGEIQVWNLGPILKPR